MHIYLVRLTSLVCICLIFNQHLKPEYRGKITFENWFNILLIKLYCTQILLKQRNFTSTELIVLSKDGNYISISRAHLFNL